MSSSHPQDASSRLVVLAVVGAAHGVRGEVKLRSFTADPMAIREYGELTGSDGNSYRIVSLRSAGKSLIARLANIEDRNAAEQLAGVELSVARSALSADALEDEEYYYADLIGMIVVDETGAELGRVIAIHDFGGGDVLEIRPSGQDSFMAPFTRAAVPRIDLAAGRMWLDRFAAGLISTDETEGGGS